MELNRGGSRISSWGGEAHLKKIAPSVGRREIFWVFRVKNTILRQKNHIFSNFRGRAPGAHPPASAPAKGPSVSMKATTTTSNEKDTLKSLSLL